MGAGADGAAHVGPRGGSSAGVLIGGGVVVLIAIAAGAWWLARPTTRAFYSDGVTIRETVRGATKRDVLWQPPMKLAAVINTTAEDYEPRLSWDENTLYLVRGKPGENADIYIATRTPGGFGEPTRLDGVCSEYDDLGPEPSRDGRALYFYSNRPGGSGGYDIWVTRCVDGAWQSPTNLGPRVNSEYNDYGPALTPDGATLYFASNRPDPRDTRQPGPDAWPATVREDLYRRTYDLYSCPMTDAGPGPAMALNRLNTPFNEGAPCVAPGGDFVYFASDRPGGRGGFDLYRARLVGGVLRAPENLGPALNTAANELDPGLAALGFGLYFSSDRPPQRVEPARPNAYDLYYSASRDVFVETETTPARGIDWAALWSAIGPNLLWALLALLLLLLPLALWRDVRRRRVSLLARCLLASLAVHAGLLLALSFWQVTAAVVDVVRGRGAIRVALSPVGGDSLAEQIRGALTDLTMPQFAAAAERPAEPGIIVTPSYDPAQLDTVRSAVTFMPQPNEIRDVRMASIDTVPVSVPRAAPQTPAARSLDVALPGDVSVEHAAEPAIDVRAAPVDNDQLQDGPPLAVSPVDSAVQLAVPRAHVSEQTSLPITPSSVRDTGVEVAIRPLAMPPPPPAMTALDGLRVPDIADAGTGVRIADREPQLRTPAVTAVPTASRAPPVVDLSTLVPPSVAVATTQPPRSTAQDTRLAADLSSLPAVSTTTRLITPAELPRLPAGVAAVPALRLPDEVAAPASAGESAASAIDAALTWLAAHQSPDGHWDGASFDAGCGGCSGMTAHPMNVTLTGLSTLAFLGAGHTHLSDGPHRDTVQHAVAWLRAGQRPDGDLRGSETMYSHAIATMALAEALAATGDGELKDVVGRAMQVIIHTPALRTAPAASDQAAGDTAIIGWQVMALHSAQLAGLDVPPEPLALARRWLARVEDATTPGVYAFQPGYPPSPEMTAEGLFIQLALGTPRDDPRTRGALAFLRDYPPTWEPEPNAYYWHFATLALFHVQGEPWVRWHEALTAELLRHQERRGKPAGSWPPDGKQAAVGGRVYQTALCTLLLEASGTLLPMLAAGRADDSSGGLRGRVTSAATGAPLAGALVRADLADGIPVAAYTGPDGRYELFFPEMPAHFALTASHPEALPKTENVASAALRAGDMVLDFALEPRARDRIVLEPVPDVHHLGNDLFEGRINSQFQKPSEGRRFEVTFEIPGDAALRRARLTMMTRGVQCAHPIRINGTEVARLGNSPANGSFGRFAAAFDAAVLHVGVNTLELRSTTCAGDLDDFEFVNVQIQLEP